MTVLITFREINEDNFDAILAMKRPESENFVCSNAKSLAQCWLYRENNDVFPYAIYADETPVGFLLLEEDLEEEELILWRIMLPPEHEGKGYGSEAVRLVINQAKDSGKYGKLTLTCSPDNLIARHVYEKAGFQPTGSILHDSIEMFIPLR
jgi:diamine N-acetyltransferase